MSRRCLVIAILAAGSLAANTGFAAEACKGSKNPKLVDELSALNEALAALAAVDTAEVRASSIQITAPSTAGASATTLVNGAQPPSFAALAIDSGVVEQKDGVITLNLNAFALKVLSEPTAWTNQSKYDDYELLRRFSVTLSSGGKGESFDRDGDGKADPALEAKELDDIITFEGRVRLGKSRDRREAYNYKEFQSEETVALIATEGSLETTILSRLRARADYPASNITNESGDVLQCVDRDSFETFINRPSVRELVRDYVADLRGTNAALDRAWLAAATKASKHVLSTLVVGGVERKDDFGPSQLYVAYRGDKPLRDDQTLKWNLQWTRTDSLDAGDPDPKVFKGGAEWANLFRTPLAKDPLLVAFAATGEHYQDVPDAAFDTIAKVSAKLELPIAGELKLPLSITWANHKDLLTDEDEIVGHFALSYDLSKLLDR